MSENSRGTAMGVRRQLLRFLLATIGAIAFGGSTQIAVAQNYPSRPVRVLVSYPAGGVADILARLVADGLARKFGQPFVVENRPGAGTALAAQALTRAAPDGYTLLVSTGSTTALIPLLRSNPGYTPEQITGVAMIGRGPLVLDVPANSPFHSVADIVAFSKANPNRLNLATQGAGVTSHLTAELFRAVTGSTFTTVHYNGGPPALTATITGQVDLYFDGVSNSAPAIHDGRLRGLAVTGERRMLILPEVPTFRELGYPDVTVYGWYGMLAPAGTPTRIIKLLNHEINTIIQSPEVQQRIERDGAEPNPMSVAEFNRMQSEEREKWRRVIEPLNIRLD